MSFEGLLKKELATIKELKDNIYPLSVPEGVKTPYISYCLSNGEYLKTLDGEQPWEFTYEVNILANSYAELKPLEQKVDLALRNLKDKKTNDSSVKQIEVDVPKELYEESVNLQRANIQFTVYF